MPGDEEPPLFEVMQVLSDESDEAPQGRRARRGAHRSSGLSPDSGVSAALRTRALRRWVAAGAVLALLLVLVVVNRPDPVRTGRALPGTDLRPATSSDSSAPPSPSATPSTEDPATADAEVMSTDGLTPESTETAGPVDNCGNLTSFPTVVANDPVEHTGVQVMVGGARVDLDTGLVRLPALGLADDEMILQNVMSGSDAYISIGDCGYSPERSRVVKVDAKGNVSPVRIPLAEGEAFGNLVSNGSEVSLMIYTANQTDQILPDQALQPIEGGPLLTLPNGYFPFGVVGDHLIGTQNSEGENGRLTLIDRNGGKTTDLGELSYDRDTQILTNNAGSVVWAGVDDKGELRVHKHFFDSGRTKSYTWPVPSGFYGQALSPDGRYVAGQLVTAQSTVEDPSGPTRFGVLDLATGEIITIRGLSEKVPYSGGVSMAFATDSSRLVVCATGKDGLRLLTWKPGSNALRESAAVVPGSGRNPYTMVVLGGA